MVPGEIITNKNFIELNKGKETKQLKVSNLGDRPIQVGSHFHFFEVNKFLSFNRQESYCMHLDIPSGTSIRFEPGEEKTVQLVAFGGRKRIYGLNNLTCAQINENTLSKSLFNAKIKKFITGDNIHEL